MKLTLLVAAGLWFLAGCGSPHEKSTASDSPPSRQKSPTGRLIVLATTGMIADAARIVGGDLVEVNALMGPGVDPHLYQPKAPDQKKLNAAQVIFYNGLHLEGKMSEIFESRAKQKRVVAVSQDIPEDRLLSWHDSQGMHDPHIWFDVKLWQAAVRTIAHTYSEADPTHAADYDGRTTGYLAELDRLDEYCRDRISELADDQRVLITSHDAFHYFGRAYAFEVVGIQGISTDTEAGLKAITDAVNLIRSRKIRAIFPETSVPRAAIERVAKDGQCRLGPELYSDALGPPDSPATNYTGMIRTNIDNVVNSLKAP